MPEDLGTEWDQSVPDIMREVLAVVADDDSIVYKSVIIDTLESFQNHPLIDAIEVICLEGWNQILWAYAKQFNINKLKWIVPGGNSGQESM